MKELKIDRVLLEFINFIKRRDKMRDYNENPIIIKDKEFKLHIFSFITILPIIIYIFKMGIYRV